MTKTLPLVLLLGIAPVMAQGPTFEVASVKINRAGDTAPQRVNVTNGADRVTINNMTARVLLQVAYRLSKDQIVGGPKWLDEDRFDVSAKAEAPSSSDALLQMLQALLKERFKLVAHPETRSTPIYALVLNRADGKLGPRLTRADADCQTLRARAGDTADPCGLRTLSSASMTGRIVVHGFDLNAVMGPVSRDAGRPIVDRTGLTGVFDLDLTWTPQMFQRPNVDLARFPDIDPSGPSIFTALQEQLGLKLEAARDDRQILVIDAIERPSEN